MIYFDSAATTLQKPPEVARAVAAAIGTMASIGRGGHAPGMRAAQAAFDCRSLACELFGAPDPDHVILTFNATHALNIAIRSLVAPGSTVLISGYEHNAVVRPLWAVPDVRVRVASAPLFDRDAMTAAFARELAAGDVDAVVCTHVSNVFGYILPVEDIAALCARRGVPFVLDASQSAGVLPVRLDSLGAAFVAMPGHKGLYGPQGTGLLLCAGDRAQPVLSGGTGSASLLREMPGFLPDRLEAGTHNICGVAGLTEGMRFVRRRGLERIARHEWRLNRRLMDGLSALPGVTVFRGDEGSQSGVSSFRVSGWDSERVGDALAARSVAVRTGLHCAPLAHETAGTLTGGTVRVSFSAFNSASQVDAFLTFLEDILQKGR